MTISIPGFSDTYKTPRFVAQLILGAGVLSSGVGVLRCLLVGMKTSGGTIVADAAPIGPYTDLDSVLTVAGNNSQLASMARAAFLASPTCQVWLGAVAEPSGTAATVTCALSGTHTAGGDIIFRINGVTYDTGIGASDTLDQIGAAVVAKVNGDTACPFTAAYNSGTTTITFTCGNKGAQGIEWAVYIDKTSLPSGLTATLTGSGATADGNGVFAGASSSGTGTEDVTNILATLAGHTFHRIGVGQNDATNAGRWKTYVEAKAAPLVQRYELLVFGANGSLSNTTSLAQTTLNEKLGQVVAARTSESHPANIAAAVAALRSSTEGGSAENGNWVPDYDGAQLVGLAPYQRTTESNQWTDTEVETLLNAGVTPLVTVDGVMVMVRAITSYSLLGGTTADDRCLDVGDVIFPTNAIVDLQNIYTTQFRVANKYVGPDPADGEPDPPPGVAYPKLWSTTVQARNRDYFNIGYIEEPDENPPTSEYNKTARRIMSVVPWVVRRIQHTIGVVGRQQSPS